MAAILRGLEGTTEERKGPRLSIEVRDFGPIASGSLTLKPLTVFVGPNNSGKSYAAMLIHSVFQSYAPSLWTRPVSLFMRESLFEEMDAGSYVAAFPDLVKRIDELEQVGQLDLPDQLVEDVSRQILSEVCERTLARRLARSFASPLKELTRIGTSSFGVSIDANSHGIHLRHQEGGLALVDYPVPDWGIRVKLGQMPGPSMRWDEDARSIEIGAGWRDVPNQIRVYQLMEAVSEICRHEMLSSMAMPCYYLPAARSGILQSHRALVASIVQKAPYLRMEPIEIPPFSGVVADFISSIITLPEEEGPFFNLAQAFEEELIKGQIVVRALDEHRYTEIIYILDWTEIPLHRSSSSVSELAPLFLYLKYGIKPGSVLIIEEPEAHLHPENQRILAKLLVRLVRRNVNLVITTHSEYLVEQLSSFILLSKIEAEERVRRYRYDEDDYLEIDEVGAYVFAYDTETGGHRISELEMTEEDGISQEEFMRVHEVLYEETLKLRMDQSSET